MEGLSFEQYLIQVGVRNCDYGLPGYETSVLLENVEYFRCCKENGLSAYKALLFLSFHLNGEYEI